MNIFRSKTKQNIILLFGITFANACSLTDATRVEEDFGTSVRQMVKAQIYDPQSAHQPATIGPDLLDGAAGVESIDGYREAAESARKTENTPDSGVIKK